MTVLRSREIVPIPKSTPKSPKMTPNTGLEPCTPSLTKEPSPSTQPGPTPLSSAGARRRSLRLAGGCGSASEPAESHRRARRRTSEIGGSVVPEEPRDWVPELYDQKGAVLSLRSGKEVSKRGIDSEVVPGDKGKGKLEYGEDSSEESVIVVDDDGGGKKFSQKEKGKEILVEDEKTDSGGNGSDSGDNNNLADEENNVADDAVPWSRRRNEQFKEIARERAHQFARFNVQGVGEEVGGPGGEGGAAVEEEVDDDGPVPEDWPGPFSTALKIIRDRERSGRRESSYSAEGKRKRKPEDVNWVPKSRRACELSHRAVPSLVDLCLKVVVDNADSLVSLEHVPDALTERMSRMLCDSRRMNAHFLRLLVQGSPMEIRLRDCSWLSEEDFVKSFQSFDTSRLTVLKLDQCGRCLPDYVILATLARSANCLPVLTTISLRGACRLSDVGLNSLVCSAPALRSVNLSQCSLLTYSSIDILAKSFGSILKELYLEDCQGIDAMLILPALMKFEQLEILSVAGIESVCDKFISKFIGTRGCNMKELILTDCVKLTNSSLKVIAENCPGLCAIDLTKCKLTDSSLGYLANGCRSIQRLKLCRNSFSDKSIAAFLETSGECLEELSLNNVRKVGCETALSISRRSGKLRILDLSWCRDLTDNALGLIVDNCPSLRTLKLFGCTQVTDVFLRSHSNSNVKIIGLEMSPVLEHL